MNLSLSLQSFKGLDYNTVVARLMRRQNIALLVRMVRLTSGGCIASAILATIFVLAQSTMNRKAIEGELANKIQTIRSAMQNPDKPSIESPKDWEIVSKFTSFGPLGIRSTSQPSQAPTPSSPLSLTLVGTFIATGQEPYAIIEDKKKQDQDMFVLNQSVFGQATLKKIFQDRVEVERAGKIEVLKLDDFGGSASPSGAGVLADGDDFVIEEAELDKGLENLPMLLTQARAVPYFKDGRSIGLRLFAIKTGSLYEKIGLKNGDILKSLNGTGLGDISQALKLFEQLKQERSINLVLERDKQDREFKYTIR